MFSDFEGCTIFMQLDQLLSLIVEQTAQAEKSGYPLPLAIVFVERKVLKWIYNTIYLM